MAPKKKKKKNQTKPKKALKKKAAHKKVALKKKTGSKKPAPKKVAAKKKRGPRQKTRNVGTIIFGRKGLRASLGGQSGDLQGLSNSASADSESVDELLEEGNAFEAEVVDGVENAPDADEGEVRTHEVSENDVPDEYLDKDK
jgi:hypothetical protein